MEKTIATPKKSLGAIRRKAVDLAHFNPVRESQLQPEQLLPLVMEPAADQVDLADWAGNNREYIERKLAQHGGNVRLDRLRRDVEQGGDATVGELADVDSFCCIVSASA